MKKKGFATLLVSSVMSMFFSSSALAADFTIEVDGKPLDAEVKIVDGRSLIPLRAVGQAMGLTVDYVKINETVNGVPGEYSYVYLSAADINNREQYVIDEDIYTSNTIKKLLRNLL